MQNEEGRNEERLEEGIIPEQPGIIVTSVGVKLKATEMPEHVLYGMHTEHQKRKPKIPQFFNEEKHRWEENPADPDYEVSYQQWLNQASANIINYALVNCVEIIHVPEHIPKANSEDFIFSLQAIGDEETHNPYHLKLQWLRFKAAPTAEDMGSIIKVVLDKLGVREEDVQAVQESFRSGKGRGTDRKGTP